MATPGSQSGQTFARKRSVRRAPTDEVGHTRSVSDRNEFPHESPVRQAARLGRQSGPFGGMFSGPPRKRVVGKFLGPSTVIGMAVIIALMLGLGALSGKVRLTPQPKTDSIATAVRDHLDGTTLKFKSGDIGFGGVSVIFKGPGNEYETAGMAVHLPVDGSFINGTFGEFGASWCVHVREGNRDVVTTNLYEKVSTADMKWSCAADGLLGINAQ